MSEKIKEVNKQEGKKYSFHWTKQLSYLTMKSVETEVDINEESMKIESTSKILGIGKGKKKSWDLKRSAVRSAETKKLINYIDLAFAAVFIIAGFSELIFFAIAALFIWTGINTSIVIETSPLGDTIKIPAANKGEAEDFVKYILSEGVIRSSATSSNLQDEYFAMIDSKSIRKTGKELVEMYKKGEISETTKVWKKGMKEWAEFGSTTLADVDVSPPESESGLKNKRMKSIAAIVIACVVLVAGVNSFRNASIINTVRDGYFTGHEDYTVGYLIDGYLKNVEWDYEVIDEVNTHIMVSGDTYTYDNTAFVEITFLARGNGFEIVDMTYNGSTMSQYSRNLFFSQMFDFVAY
jgi:hypothetical protein